MPIKWSNAAFVYKALPNKTVFFLESQNFLTELLSLVFIVLH